MAFNADYNKKFKLKQNFQNKQFVNFLKNTNFATLLTAKASIILCLLHLCRETFAPHFSVAVQKAVPHI